MAGIGQKQKPATPLRIADFHRLAEAANLEPFLTANSISSSIKDDALAMVRSVSGETPNRSCSPPEQIEVRTGVGHRSLLSGHSLLCDAFRN